MSKTWKDYYEEVKEKGFSKASPLARLVWSCDVGDIDQHAGEDLHVMIDMENRLFALEAIAAAVFERLKADVTACQGVGCEWELGIMESINALREEGKSE